jgi:hypothetical protein
MRNITLYMFGPVSLAFPVAFFGLFVPGGICAAGALAAFIKRVLNEICPYRQAAWAPSCA